jgi:hypothetical protein
MIVLLIFFAWNMPSRATMSLAASHNVRLDRNAILKEDIVSPGFAFKEAGYSPLGVGFPE